MLSGDRFSPSNLEAVTAFRLRAKIEPQQIGASGKYRGAPVPFGSGIIDFERTDPTSDVLTVDPRIVDLLTKKKDTLYALGVSEISVQFNIEYSGQCNLEVTPASLLTL